MHHPRSLCLLMALAACGGKAAPTETVEPEAIEPAPVEPAPVEPEAPAAQAFAALFTEGAIWSVSVSSRDHAVSHGGPWSTPVTATCRAARRRDADGIKLIEIACGDGWPELGVDPLTGAWAMTAAGVWRLRDFPDDGVTPEAPADWTLVPFSPVPGVIEMDVPIEGPAYVTFEREGDAWCYEEQVAYESWWRKLCVDPDGPTRGHWNGPPDGLLEMELTVTRR